eukprot:s4448_g6.t1
MSWSGPRGFLPKSNRKRLLTFLQPSCFSTRKADVLAAQAPLGHLYRMCADKNEAMTGLCHQHSIAHKVGQPLPFLPPPGGFAPMPPMGFGGVPMGARYGSLEKWPWEEQGKSTPQSSDQPMAPMAPMAMTAPMAPMPQTPQAPAAPTFTEDGELEQKANMERLAQLPPTELEKLPSSTKVQLLEYLQKCPKPTDSRVKAEIVK